MKKFIVQYYNESGKKWEDFNSYEGKSEAKESQKMLKKDGVGKTRIWKIRKGGEDIGNQRTIQSVFRVREDKVNA